MTANPFQPIRPVTKLDGHELRRWRTRGTMLRPVCEQIEFVKMRWHNVRLTMLLIW